MGNKSFMLCGTISHSHGWPFMRFEMAFPFLISSVQIDWFSFIHIIWFQVWLKGAGDVRKNPPNRDKSHGKTYFRFGPKDFRFPCWGEWGSPALCDCSDASGARGGSGHAEFLCNLIGFLYSGCPAWAAADGGGRSGSGSGRRRRGCDEAEPLSREDWEVLRLQTTKKMKMEWWGQKRATIF